MEHWDALTLAALALTATACQPPPLNNPSPPRGSGVHLGAAQIERVNEMGCPGPAPTDSTNRFADDPAAARLGQFLFFDPKLSRTGEISCATCHDPARAFTDGLALNKGLSQGIRNTPSLFDCAHQQWLNWDGQFDSLWSQAHGPMLHPREMGSSLGHIVQRVRDEPLLRTQYESVFGSMTTETEDALAFEGIVANLGKAIAAYERKLVTGPSALDRWIDRWRAKGMPRDVSEVDSEDFSAAAQRGLDTFTSRGECWQCHVGPLLSDGEFHALGAAPRNDLIADSGRFGAIQKLQANRYRSSGAHSDDPTSEQGKVVDALVAQPDQWGAFRTPTLRNVAKTAPYFHQGQFATLEEVLQFYSTLEGAVTMDHHRESVLRRRDFSASELEGILALLRSLNGSDPPADLLNDPWNPSKKN